MKKQQQKPLARIEKQWLEFIDPLRGEDERKYYELLAIAIRRANGETINGFSDSALQEYWERTRIVEATKKDGVITKPGYICLK